MTWTCKLHTSRTRLVTLPAVRSRSSKFATSDVRLRLVNGCELGLWYGVVDGHDVELSTFILGAGDVDVGDSTGLSSKWLSLTIVRSCKKASKLYSRSDWSDCSPHIWPGRKGKRVSCAVDDWVSYTSEEISLTPDWDLRFAMATSTSRSRA